MANEENDESMLGEIRKSVKAITGEVEKMTLDTLLSGHYDRNNAIMTFHAGAGGTEAQDWCEMLIRMYQMYAQKNGYTFDTLDMLPGDDAGVKSATVMIGGLNAYGYLKSEKGVHRLVRISPFDASGRRHTSFASIEVMPEIDDDVEIDIRTEDLKVDTYRASGAGGQHINKTDSAVRITHIPTGVVASCQTQRSQHQNREYAMRMLKAKLVEIAEQQRAEKIADIKGVQKEIAWGSQIRSYVFHPYTMVKDHRTSYEVGNVGAVMDGDLDGFVNAYLKAASLGQLE
jgi:peptide chain release factor 2